MSLEIVSPLLLGPRAFQMAAGVTRVIHRCQDAEETRILDLSECQLMHVPDAVYHLMRHTELKCCNLSSNVITKIPPKFAVKFSLITELNLAHNQMSKLPDELSDLGQLERLDISRNSFISLPNVVFKIPQLKSLSAQRNHIVACRHPLLNEEDPAVSVLCIPHPVIPAKSSLHLVWGLPELHTDVRGLQYRRLDVEIERILDAPSLQDVDLQENPLTPRCHDGLSGLSMIRVKLTPRQKEDWEDLTI